MHGRAKCKILKDIRQAIADENDIPYVTGECTYQGDCSGTCPRCERELKYLEDELAKRRRLGKQVAVTALCSGIVLGTAACAEDDPGDFELAGAPEVHDYAITQNDNYDKGDTEVEELAGAAEVWPDEPVAEEMTEEERANIPKTPDDAFDGLKSFASTFNSGGVYSGAQSCPVFTSNRNVMLKALSTYHWNGGMGAVPGSIRIYEVTEKEDILLGTWDATARGGSGADNVYWDIFPEIELLEGHTYHIIDSGADTWSTNEQAGFMGFVELMTDNNDEEYSGSFEPCGTHEHTDN